MITFAIEGTDGRRVATVNFKTFGDSDIEILNHNHITWGRAKDSYVYDAHGKYVGTWFNTASGEMLEAAISNPDEVVPKTVGFVNFNNLQIKKLINDALVFVGSARFLDWDEAEFASLVKINCPTRFATEDLFRKNLQGSFGTRAGCIALILNCFT